MATVAAPSPRTPASAVRSFARPEPVEQQDTGFQPQEGWLAVFLLLAMVLSTVWSIDQAKWVEGTGILFPLALAGMAGGFLLARSALSGWVAVLLGLVGGTAICFVTVGQLVPAPAAMLGALLQTLGGTLAWFARPTGVPPLIGAFQQFFSGAAEFGGRVGIWTEVGTSGRVSNDNAIFLLFIAYIAWLQGFLGAFGLFRLRDVIVTALPTGIALATNAAYTGQASAPFFIFIVTLLLLAVSLNLTTLQVRWNRYRVDYPSGLLFDVTVSSFVVICLLAVLAFFGPRAADNPLSNAFWAYAGEQWSEVENASNRLFAGVNSPQAGGAGAGRDRLVLSGPVRLSQRVVMTVKSDEPYYWRGATYDTWTGHDWLSSDKIPLSRTEKQAVLPQRFGLRKRIKAEFEINQSRSDLIYTPDEPVQISIPYKVFTRAADANVQDFSALRAKKPAIPKLTYSVEAMASIASAEELRNAQTDLPDWAKRYLQVPDVPQRVRDLSRQIVGSRRSPYDKAVAIEQFLRRYPYTLDVRPAPSDRDAVEYFLFDLKQGYCDYFASAMVVLLRLQGVPARLATGYVAGKFDNTTNKFVVTEEEAHSWPEVYFPGYGWTAFEPSGYRPPIVRPEQSVATPMGDPDGCYDYEYGECSEGMDPGLEGFLPDPGDVNTIITVGQPAGSFNWLPVALAVLVVLAIGAAVIWLLNRIGGRQVPTHELARRTYRRMTLFGQMFGLKRDPAQTPLEYARALTRGIERTLDQEGAVGALRLRQLVGTPNGAAETIASTFVRSQYGHQELTELDRENLEDGWRDLRLKLPVLLLRDRRN
ncbi:MAG TPA: transglutaminaseTgpA domain-containing protein [Chloroflexota bacterium]|nr:transglutaminaseTgpA domain-containing protein [Chloroflexota bacterium]